MMIWAIIATIAMSAGISMLATPMVRQLAERIGMMDIPQRHKGHAGPVPLLGGSAVFTAILLPSLLALALVKIWAEQGAPGWLPEALAIHIPGAATKACQAIGILTGAMILHIVGLIDDRRNLGPWLKLIVELLVAGGVVILLDVRILTVAGDAVSITASIVWLVAITNAFNFLDNMDGLSAGVAAICATALLGATAMIGQIFVSAWLCLILGALLGFLPYNFAPASIYMGDSGSLVVGFLLGVTSCLTTYGLLTPMSYHYGLIVPLVLMAVPLYDTASVILLRIRERRNPMVGDRRHFSHRLIRRGMSVRSAVLTIYLCTAATAVSASLLPHVATATGAILILCQTIGIIMLVALLESGDAKP